MGQTLTHGVYLPDEGERNCYSGLAANWQILDTSVGTIAANTAALAGKAPLVHTHTVSQITDFPAYGNAAGTICEGNDSRLSDARTPVAHTHTKSDVTDLFNSSNTWTSWQTLENTNANSLLRLRRTDIKIGDAIPSTQKEIGGICFSGSDNINLGLIATRDESSGHTRLVFAARQKYDSNGNRANNGNSYEARVNLGVDESHKYYLSPNTNGDIDLGSSSYQWNKLYAKKVNTQSVNGLNPGALGIPNKDNKVNIASEFTDLTGGNNFYIPPADGFVSINADTEIYCAVVSSTHNTVFWRQSAVATTTGYASVTIPVRAGLHLLAKIKSTGAIYAEFYPCLGNV